MDMTKKDKKLFKSLNEYLNGHIGDAISVLRYVKYVKYHNEHWLDNYFKEKKAK